MRKNPPKGGAVKQPASVSYLPTVEWRDILLPHWATPDDHFALSEVCGDSLSAAGIKDGDFVLIYLTLDVAEGDLIAVTTPQGFLVKFLSYLPDGRLCLQGAGKELEPRAFLPSTIHIEGRIIR